MVLFWHVLTALVMLTGRCGCLLFALWLVAAFSGDPAAYPRLLHWMPGSGDEDMKLSDMQGVVFNLQVELSAAP